METMEGVQYIHNNNIVHRDLTAANVFISASRQVKLSGLIHAREVTGDTITGQFTVAACKSWHDVSPYNT